MTEAIANFLHDLRFAARSLWRAKGLTITVIATLALGIGANAAIFSVVRGVLLRPLANRDENRLIYIRQSAPGNGSENEFFSVPEIQDLRASVKTLSSIGDFSTIGFTMVGLGEPREIRAASSADRISMSWACTPCSAVCSTPATTAPTPPAPWS